ncbi:hypothetical protein HK100_000623 [Physocladia obscura]|uniref:Uncharacterized protein n=1 Tax=Physocladia obscura TaxID=109957 RepID=A0AAD5T0M9_9FUNG|nr:hypothetical protein HK100_000623 [Physocladia obscura]
MATRRKGKNLKPAGTDMNSNTGGNGRNSSANESSVSETPAETPVEKQAENSATTAVEIPSSDELPMTIRDSSVKPKVAVVVASETDIQPANKQDDSANNIQPPSAKKRSATTLNETAAPISKHQKKISVSPSRVPLPVRKSKSLGNIFAAVSSSSVPIFASVSPSTSTKNSKSISAVPKYKPNTNVASRTDSGLTKNSAAIILSTNTAIAATSLKQKSSIMAVVKSRQSSVVEIKHIFSSATNASTPSTIGSSAVGSKKTAIAVAKSTVNTKSPTVATVNTDPATIEKKTSSISLKRQSVAEVSKKQTSALVNFKKNEMRISSITTANQQALKSKHVVIQPKILKAENERLITENIELKKKLETIKLKSIDSLTTLLPLIESKNSDENSTTENSANIDYETLPSSIGSTLNETDKADFQLEMNNASLLSASNTLFKTVEKVGEESASKIEFVENNLPKRAASKRGRKTKDAAVADSAVVVEFHTTINAGVAESAETVEVENFRTSRSRRGTKIGY